jgi:hypothetical protein
VEGSAPTWIHHQSLGEEKEYLFRNRQLKFRQVNQGKEEI